MTTKNSCEPPSGEAFGIDRLSANSLGELEQMLDNLEQALEVIEKSIFSLQFASRQKHCDSEVVRLSQSSQ
jgi:hypothetical protein